MTFLKEEIYTKVELEWLFHFSEADCNLKSNWTAVLNVSCFGPTTTFIDPYNSFILSSSAHRRAVLKIFSKLPDSIQNILYATFGTDTYHPLVEKVLNKYTGAAYCIMEPTDLVKLCNRINSHTSSNQDKLLFSKLRTEAQTKYHHAIKFYQITKQQMERDEKI